MQTDAMDVRTLESPGLSTGASWTQSLWATDEFGWPVRCRPTRWSVVLAAAEEGDAARAALGKLYRTYWYPVFDYVALRRGREAASELTQGFFAERLVGGRDLRRVQHTPGRRFRGWLFTAVDSFLKNQWKFERQQCRDVRKTVAFVDEDDSARPSSLAELCEAADRAPYLGDLPATAVKPPSAYATLICPVGNAPGDPEQRLTRKRAYELLSDVLGRLRREYCEKAAIAKVDGERRFNVVKVFLPGRDMEVPHFKAPAKVLGMEPGAVKQLVDRLRRRFADLLDEELLLSVVDSETDLASAKRLLCEALEGPDPWHEDE